ncbi:hypothetical protein LPJ64_005222 [Coemansia asiatica]|uniref:Uncharacterized protein n=1 Tax=Coemansia asiatica TaxID=1052880 RepID=A0A9W8CH62_9FUNG|nr:hypothetical protein LPJ64_005222 [Coemansia asiatica]
MFSHAYFLIDAGMVVSSSDSISHIVTRILAFLISRNESLTWNFEIVDMSTRQRAMAAQGKRRVSERKKPSAETIAQLEKALADYLQQRKPASTSRRAVLDTLHERMMCLEADVEWGDPALMRSPTRNVGTRAWTDPMRLNESMSVRSYLYVLGQMPGSLDTLDRFVYGSANGTYSLLEKLTFLRDGIIGNGIWENYTRKRVSVSWIKPTAHKSIVEMDPVSILITSTFECCFEALGGCVISAKELCNPLVPFSSIFEPLHRERTFPSWSRKFAHEISAVVEKFLVSARHTVENQQNLDAMGLWVVQGNKDSGVDSFRMRKIEYEPRRWLREGRLLRNFNLEEMIALASEYQTAIVKRQERNDCKVNNLVSVCTVPMSAWPSVLRMISSECIQFETIDSLYSVSDFLDKRFIIAKSCSFNNTSVSEQTSDFAYFAVVPAGLQTALVYGLDTYVFDQALEISNDCEQLTDLSLEPFDPAWLEDWACRIPGQMNIEPTDDCVIDIQYEDNSAENSGLSLETASHSKLCSSPNSVSANAFNDSSRSNSSGSSVLVSEEPCSEINILDLNTWFEAVYLKRAAHSVSSRLEHAINSLETLFDNYENNAQKDQELDKLRTAVLLSSSSIDDAFSASAEKHIAQSLAANQHCNDSSQYLLLRQRMLSDMNVSEHRQWQLYECQLQIILHLFVIEQLRMLDTIEGKQIVDQLVEALNDLADQLCIWVSVDDLSGVLMPVTSTATVNTSSDVPNDPAAAFVGGPLVGRFASSLEDLVEDLRTQCGWVPQPSSTHDMLLADSSKSDADMAGDCKRRKGTPRKINRSMSDRSEVIVDQRKRSSKIMSGRRLARHLDELIGGNGGKGSLHSHSRSSGRRSSNILQLPLPSKPNSLRRQSAQLKMPAHLIRQIKSEVVSTARKAVKSHSATATSCSNGGGNSTSIGRSNTLRMKASRRLAIPSYMPESSSAPALAGRSGDMCIVPEAQASKRQRTSDYVPMRTAASALFLQRNGRNMLCEGNDKTAGPRQISLDSSPLSADTDISDMQSIFSRELFDALQDSDEGEGGIYIYDHSSH